MMETGTTKQTWQKAQAAQSQTPEDLQWSYNSPCQLNKDTQNYTQPRKDHSPLDGHHYKDSEAWD